MKDIAVVEREYGNMSGIVVGSIIQLSTEPMQQQHATVVSVAAHKAATDQRDALLQQLKDAEQALRLAVSKKLKRSAREEFVAAYFAKYPTEK